MIYVNKDQIKQVEYLLGQSALGNHILFEPETLRRVFENDQDFLSSMQASPDEAYSVEHHIERIIDLPTLAQKRAYLEKLDLTTHDKVVRAYFNIVENSLYENLKEKH